MSTYGKIIRNFLGSIKPPRLILVDQIWTVLTEKEPCKVKPPLKAPKKSRDFWKFLGFLKPNRVELTTREYLNYSNNTWKRSLILKIPCVLKIFSKPRALQTVLRPALRGWDGERKLSRCLPNTSTVVPDDRWWDGIVVETRTWLLSFCWHVFGKEAVRRNWPCAQVGAGGPGSLQGDLAKGARVLDARTEREVWGRAQDPDLEVAMVGVRMLLYAISVVLRPWHQLLTVLTCCVHVRPPGWLLTRVADALSYDGHCDISTPRSPPCVYLLMRII